MKREKTVIDVDVSEEKQREIVQSLFREHTNVGMKFEREKTRQAEMVSVCFLSFCSSLQTPRDRHKLYNVLQEPYLPSDVITGQFKYQIIST